MWLKNKILLKFMILLILMLKKSIADSHKKEIINQLQSLGYLPNHLKINHKQLQHAIEKFQQHHKLNVTGRVEDSEFLKVISKPRCGVPDGDRNRRSSRQKRFSAWHVKWKNSQISWFFVENHDKFNRDSSIILPEIRRAFDEWSRHTKLTFHQASSDESADILISFEAPYHPEVDHFEMSGTILAHAFFPRKGDIHLRNDLSWNFNEKPMRHDENSFYIVLLHEIGHSLGLRHSKDQNAVMYGIYGNQKEKLHYDDIQGIQHLYGVPESLKTSTNSPSNSNSHHDDNNKNCDISSIDAIAMIRSELMIFKDIHMWRLNYGDHKTPIRYLWPDLPEDFQKIDAIHEHENEIWIFLRKEIWIFEGVTLIRRIHLYDLGISDEIEKIDAIFKWHKNQATYIFAGEKYWRMDERKKNLQVIKKKYPRLIEQSWREIYDIDSIFDDGKSVFVFKGKHFYEFNDLKMRLEWSKPQSIANKFMNCPVITNRFHIVASEHEEEEEVKDYIIYGDIPEYPDDDENIEKMNENDSSAELIANIRLPILIFSAMWILV